MAFLSGWKALKTHYAENVLVNMVSLWLYVHLLFMTLDLINCG